MKKRTTRKKPEDADAWARLGKCYRELGKYKKALKALSCSLNIDSNNYFAIEELGILTQFLNEDAASMNFIAELLNKNNDSDPDLDTLRSSMTVRETALDAMEKDENKNGEDVLDGNAFGGEKNEDENRDKDEDDFSVSSAEIGFESLRQKEDEGEDAVLKLDAAADEPLFHDEYDPLIFPESFFSGAENEKSFEQKDKEPFDLSNLFPIDSPLEITPTDKDELFDDFFDKKSSQHYDPVEEEELLTVEGSGFEPDDEEDGEDRRLRKDVEDGMEHGHDVRVAARPEGPEPRTTGSRPRLGSVMRDHCGSPGRRILAWPAPAISKCRSASMPVRCSPSTNLRGLSEYPLRMILAMPTLEEYQMLCAAVIVP